MSKGGADQPSTHEMKTKIKVAAIAVPAYCAFSIFGSWRSGKLAAAVEANEKDSLAGTPAR